ncbi:hypothetical protein CM19_06930 [Candidatus Acidianus copahuensis]|uniref:Uncharacterized protein n=1 Tax=Candidatus Acidianus copahuensis TaxID=1160895 RepID=A0A031LPY4_9CREN|nr:hypothetical protein [Candidatus Acidianus copahuensis]EZQ07071.1 hypothetical protein CM19_06930 [Candidatus Acidianus copahuensis]
MKALNPFFYYFIFFEATVIAPIIVNGARIYSIWYSPLADTGRSTFLLPFLIFVVIVIAVSIVIGMIIFRIKKGRFILVTGPMRPRSVIKAVTKDSLGRWLVIGYFLSYLISYLVVSGILLIPNLNVSQYFLDLTAITYLGEGINVIPLGSAYLVINLPLILLGFAVDFFLTISMILSYYLVSLVYVSANIYSFPVPKSMRIYSLSTAGGFLTASVPSLGTIAGICCLTPTAINSLLYLASGTLPLTKGLAWKYGTFIAGAWTGGILQVLNLVSPMILGGLMLGISIYYIYLISKRLNRVLQGE